MKTKIKKFWENNKWKILTAGLLAAVIIFIFPELTLAQGAAGGAATGGESAGAATSKAMDETYQQIAKMLNTINEILQRVLWPVLLLIGGLLKNDILFGAGMEETMYKIWANIRDFVNIFFVLVLLGIALYNVLGIQNQNFQLKTILPKFVIALIAVNFSFLAVKVVIDSVNVLTTAIFSLPAVVSENVSNPGIVDNLTVEESVCEAIYGRKGTDYDQNVASAAAESGSAMCTAGEARFTEDLRNYFTRWDANNAALVLAINMQKLPALNKLEVLQPNMKNVMLSTAFSAILFAIYATAFVALFVILLVRLVVLWVLIVLSPLMVLKYVLPDNMKSLLGGGDDITKKLIQTVIIPIPIAVVLTIGYIMLDGMMKAKFSEASLSSSTLSLSLFASQLSTLQDIIVAVGTVAVIWMGVFAASKGTFADKAVEGIEKAVSGAGSFVAGSWKYLPLVPVKGEKYSVAALGETLRQIPLQRAHAANEKAQELMGHMGMGTGRLEGQKLRKAANWGDVQKQFYAAGAAGAATPDFQEGFHVYIQKNREEYKRQFNNLGLSSEKLKSTDGTELNSWEKLEKALKEEKVDDQSMTRLREKITGGMDTAAKDAADAEKRAEDAEKEKAAKGKGAAGAGKTPREPVAAAGTAAGAVAGAAAAEPEAKPPLTGEAKENIVKANGASAYARAAGVENSGDAGKWKEEDYQKVQDKIEERKVFQTKVKRAQSKEQIVDAIQGRRAELGVTENSSDAVKAEADGLLRLEINQALDDYVSGLDDAGKKAFNEDPEIAKVRSAKEPTASGVKPAPAKKPKPKAGGGAE